MNVDEMQCGFMFGNGMLHAVLFILRILKYERKKRKFYKCLVDLEKLFDRVPRKVIEVGSGRHSRNSITVV